MIQFYNNFGIDCVCSVQRNVCISVLFLVLFRYLYGKFINILPYEIGVDS